MYIIIHIGSADEGKCVISKTHMDISLRKPVTAVQSPTVEQGMSGDQRHLGDFKNDFEVLCELSLLLWIYFHRRINYLSSQLPSTALGCMFLHERKAHGPMAHGIVNVQCYY